MFWQCMYCVSMISPATGTCGLPKCLTIRIFSQSKITELTLLTLPLCVSVLHAPVRHAFSLHECILTPFECQLM